MAILNQEDITGKLKAMVQEITGEKELTLDLNADFYASLKLDSVRIMSLLFAIETEFQISLQDDDLTNIKTTGQFVDLIRTKTA